MATRSFHLISDGRTRFCFIAPCSHEEEPRKAIPRVNPATTAWLSAVLHCLCSYFLLFQPHAVPCASSGPSGRHRPTLIQPYEHHLSRCFPIPAPLPALRREGWVNSHFRPGSRSSSRKGPHDVTASDHLPVRHLTGKGSQGVRMGLSLL